MAKEYRQLNIDLFLEKCYQNGLLHSLIINSSILLVLAIVVSGQNIVNKPISINLSEHKIETDIDLEKFAEIKITEHDEKQKQQDLSDINIDFCFAEEPEDFDTPDIDSNTDSSLIKILGNITAKEYCSELILNGSKKSADQVVVANKNNNSASLGEMEKRLTEAGAMTGDVQISISWDNYNDIDVWVVLENQYGKFCINWMNKIGPNNGFLDIDMNVKPTTNMAVENIYWPHGLAPEGRYTIYVQNYQVWDKRDITGVQLRVINPTQKEPFYKKLSISSSEGVKKVYTFTYNKKKN